MNTVSVSHSDASSFTILNGSQIVGLCPLTAETSGGEATLVRASVIEFANAEARLLGCELQVVTGSRTVHRARPPHPLMPKTFRPVLRLIG